MLWVSPSGQLRKTQLLACSSTQWDRGSENQKGKNEKTCGLRDCNRSGKSHAHKAKILDSCSPSHKQVYIQKSRASACTMFTWEAKCQEHPLPSCSSNLLLLGMTTYDMEYLFYQFESPGLTAFLLVHPHLLTGGVKLGAKKSLNLGKHCVAITKTSLYYQHCFGGKSKT